jgi:hypothetical protein
LRYGVRRSTTNNTERFVERQQQGTRGRSDHGAQASQY